MLDPDSKGTWVPGIADHNSILWAMGKKIDDTVAFMDERGRSFDVKLVAGIKNSILQGSILIDEEAFLEKYPSASGYEMVWVDVGGQPAEFIARELRDAFQDYGMEITTTTHRLASLHAVQNTYIAVFQVLGGLGLLLGSAGLGIVVLRNVFERRSEFAILRAVGFGRLQVLGLVVREHVGLLLLGLAVGGFAAYVSAIPILIGFGSDLTMKAVFNPICIVCVHGLLWTLAAAWFATRGPLLNALRCD